MNDSIILQDGEPRAAVHKGMKEIEACLHPGKVQISCLSTLHMPSQLSQSLYPDTPNEMEQNPPTILQMPYCYYGYLK